LVLGDIHYLGQTTLASDGLTYRIHPWETAKGSLESKWMSPCCSADGPMI